MPRTGSSKRSSERSTAVPVGLTVSAFHTTTSSKSEKGAVAVKQRPRVAVTGASSFHLVFDKLDEESAYVDWVFLQTRHLSFKVWTVVSIFWTLFVLICLAAGEGSTKNILGSGRLPLVALALIASISASLVLTFRQTLPYREFVFLGCQMLHWTGVAWTFCNGVYDLASWWYGWLMNSIAWLTGCALMGMVRFQYSFYGLGVFPVAVTILLASLTRVGARGYWELHEVGEIVQWPLLLVPCFLQRIVEVHLRKAFSTVLRWRKATALLAEATKHLDAASRVVLPKQIVDDMGLEQDNPRFTVSYADAAVVKVELVDFARWSVAEGAAKSVAALNHSFFQLIALAKERQVERGSFSGDTFLGIVFPAACPNRPLRAITVLEFGSDVFELETVVPLPFFVSAHMGPLHVALVGEDPATLRFTGATTHSIFSPWTTEEVLHTITTANNNAMSASLSPDEPLLSGTVHASRVLMDFAHEAGSFVVVRNTSHGGLIASVHCHVDRAVPVVSSSSAQEAARTASQASYSQRDGFVQLRRAIGEPLEPLGDVDVMSVV